MRNGWSGGQFSVFRVCLAVATLIQLGSWSHPGEAASTLALSLSSPWLFFAVILGAICLGLGWFARPAALLLIPFTALAPANSPWETLHLSLLLAVFMLLPAGPYGSLKARGRQDPNGDWALPEWVRAGVWSLWTGLFLALHSGIASGELAPDFLSKLFQPSGIPILLTLAGIPWCFRKKWQPLGWCLMAVAQILACLQGFGSGCFPSFLLLLLAANPGWLAPKVTGSAEWMFYDGSCGLCHRACRFVLAEDRTGQLFRFAPLDGFTFNEEIPEDQRENLPDSVLILTQEGRLISESDAAIHICGRLGGLWRICARMSLLIPKPIRQNMYRFIARIRYKVFAKPSEACPVIPPKMRVRFGP